MVVPLVASGQCLAVIALTDRADGLAFESRDLASARLLAAPAALALARDRVSRKPGRADPSGDRRPGDWPLQPPVFRDSDSGRSPARSTPAAGSRPPDGRHRRLQAHQRHARASRRRPRFARRREPPAPRCSHLRFVRSLWRGRVRDPDARRDTTRGRAGCRADSASHSGPIASECCADDRQRRRRFARGRITPRKI